MPTPCDLNNHCMCYGDPEKVDFVCDCPCHDEPLDGKTVLPL